jgi:hypothetical protein
MVPLPTPLFSYWSIPLSFLRSNLADFLRRFKMEAIFQAKKVANNHRLYWSPLVPFIAKIISNMIVMSHWNSEPTTFNVCFNFFSNTFIVSKEYMIRISACHGSQAEVLRLMPLVRIYNLLGKPIHVDINILYGICRVSVQPKKTQLSHYQFPCRIVNNGDLRSNKYHSCTRMYRI